MIPGIFAAGAMGQSGGGGGGFVYPPAAIYDPSDLSTLFQDSAGTTPVTTDGDPVGRFNDATGSGRDFIQATSGNRPVYRNSGGYHWIDFTVGQFMYGTSVSMLSFASAALFLGRRTVAGSNDYANILGVPHAATHTPPYWRWNLAIRNTGGQDFAYTNNGSQQLNNISAAAAVGNDVIFAMGYSSMWNQSAGAMRSGFIRINKAAWNAGSVSVVTQTYPTATLPYMGAAAGGSSDRFQGRLYGALVADAAVTSQAWIDEWESWIDTRTP